MYYTIRRLTFIVPLGLCFIHTLSSSFNHNFNQQQHPDESSSTAFSSRFPTQATSSFEPLPSEEISPRTKPFLKQAIFNKGFGLLSGGRDCCPCSECCLCVPPGAGGDYPDPGIFEDPNGPIIPALYNRFGETATLSSSSGRRVIRRRYVRPNGLMVVEIEEQPGGYRPSLGGGNGGLFGGGGLFSRFIPSAIENDGNFTRRQQISPSETPTTSGISQSSLNPPTKSHSNNNNNNNNNQRRIRIRVQG